MASDHLSRRIPSGSDPAKRRPVRRFRPHVEALEDRVLLSQRALVIPGEVTQSVPAAFHLNVRDAAFHNEVGIFLVDDSSGRIGAFHPGDPGYDATALGRRQILFTVGQHAGARRILNLPGGTFFGLYLIQNSTSRQFLRHNASDRLTGEPLAFFSFARANPDHFKHVRQLGNRVVAFEDGTFGGDRDFNDAVVTVAFGTPQPELMPPPMIRARLAHDTGISASDRITNDPSITGNVSASGGSIVSFRAGFDNTPPAGFANVLDTLQANGDFTFDVNRMRSLAGGMLPDGSHTLHLQASDSRGQVSTLDLSFTLLTTAPPLTFDLDPATDTPPIGDHRTTIDPTTNPTGAATLRAVSAANVTVSLVTQITIDAAGNMTTTHPGLSAPTTSGGAASFGVSLADGPNDFFMTATDAAGNTTTFEQVITRNDPPTVSTPIGDVNVPQNSPPTMIDLGTHFGDVDRVNSIARTDTPLGRIDVLLFDQTTPAGQPIPAQTVANFLTYVNSGAYTNTVVHRSVRVSDAGVDVIQGGGFALNNQGFLNTNHIPTNPPIPDEPGISNTRGTIAMAKSGPNTATSEWFINRIDNLALDNPAQPSGAFTVFGQVLGNGMQVVDTIAAVPTFNFGGAFSNIPLRNFSSADVSNFPQSATAGKVVLTDWSLFRRRDQLTFSITGNDNPGLVTPSINGNQLTLTYTQNMTGTAHITVRATDLDGASVENRFTVTVM